MLLWVDGEPIIGLIWQAEAQTVRTGLASMAANVAHGYGIREEQFATGVCLVRGRESGNHGKVSGELCGGQNLGKLVPVGKRFILKKRWSL